MNKYKLILILAILSSLVQCQEKNNLNHLGEEIDKTDHNITKFVKVSNMHIAFDFMPMKEHMQMMKAMNSTMNHLPDATHGLMVTVMNYDTKKTITDAKVSLTITYPNGKVIKSRTEVLSGEGMHHYAIHLSAQNKGSYKISAQITVNGKVHLASTIFELNNVLKNN